MQGIAWLVIPQPWSFQLPAYTYNSWRVLVVLSAVPGFITAILYSFLPESPKFLLGQRKESECLIILNKMYTLNTGERAESYPVVTTFELPGCVDMWTVIGSKEAVDDTNSGEHEYTHSFMILSQHESTMILQTGQEINEVDHSGFSTQGPTVYAGNLGYNRFIIQVNNNMFSFHKA
ncbi:unnamed protein product [Timema podura]|uniref:RSE1/DDB1/CPSF1 second beta-propeller domain-containing protein n=1 Tax=Timema podura TaxID=61482 RepID=A0ABN7P140_TIMPD|nr:unnamed protein product [Timema podura]